MFWGFALGDLVHGRLGERFGYRRVVLLGALATAAFNVLASYGDDVASLAIPWAIVGFVNAATWAPGIGLLAQWWSRRERGEALGWVLTAAGVALLLVWIVSPAVAFAWGWRAALRYPPLLIAVLGIAFWFVARDRPSDVGLPAYSEDDAVSRDAESAAQGRAHGLTAYVHLLSNWRFFIACQVKGLDNVVRYGIVSWAPVYYVHGRRDSISSTMAWITFAYPVGYLFAPLTGGDALGPDVPGQPLDHDRNRGGGERGDDARHRGEPGGQRAARGRPPLPRGVHREPVPGGRARGGSRGEAPRGHRLGRARRPWLRLWRAAGLALRPARGRDHPTAGSGYSSPWPSPASSRWPPSGASGLEPAPVRVRPVG